MKKKEEFEVVKISSYIPSGNKDTICFDDFEEFKRLVLNAFELPDGTLIGINELTNYMYKKGGFNE